MVGLLAGRLFAQPAPMDLQDCIRYVLANGTGITQAQLEAEKAQLQVEELRAQGLPSLSLNSDLLYNFARPVEIAPGNLFDSPERDIPIRFGKDIQTGVDISIRQPLFIPAFAVGSEGREKLVEVNRLQILRSRESAALEVGKAYYQALSVKQQRGLLEANLQRVESLLRLTRRQYENGFAKEIDVDRLIVAQNNLTTKLRNLDLQYDRLLYVLKYRMSMPLDSTIALPDSLTDTGYRLPEELDTPLDTAQRTELALLRLRSDLNQLQVDRLQAGNWPRIYLQGALRLNAWGDTPSEWVSTDYWYGNSYLGIRLEYSIFNGYERRAQVQQAKLDVSLARHELATTRQSLLLQYYNAQQQLRINFNELKMLRENLQIAEKIFRVTQGTYEEGITPVMELLTAEASYREAQTNYLNALVEVKVAELEWWHAKGELLERVRE